MSRYPQIDLNEFKPPSECIMGEQCNCRHNQDGCQDKPEPESTCFGIVCWNYSTAIIYGYDLASGPDITVMIGRANDD